MWSPTDAMHVCTCALAAMSIASGDGRRLLVSANRFFRIVHFKEHVRKAGDSYKGDSFTSLRFLTFRCALESKVPKAAYAGLY